MSEEMPSNPSAATRFLIVIAVFLVLAGAVAYSFHERSIAKQLGAQNSQMSSALNATRDQISALTTKLNAMNTEQTPEKSSPSPGPVPDRSAQTAQTPSRTESPVR